MIIHSRRQQLLLHVCKKCTKIVWKKYVRIFNSLSDRLTEPIGFIIKSEYIFHIRVNVDIWPTARIKRRETDEQLIHLNQNLSKIHNSINYTFKIFNRAFSPPKLDLRLQFAGTSWFYRTGVFVCAITASTRRKQRNLYKATQFSFCNNR